MEWSRYITTELLSHQGYIQITHIVHMLVMTARMTEYKGVQLPTFQEKNVVLVRNVIGSTVVKEQMRTHEAVWIICT